MPKNTILIVIPTYNEKENIPRLLLAIKKQNIGADILVVDDNSPDGTGEIVERISKRDRAVFVLHREKKEGLGKAYVAGFKWGIKRGYKKLISMDADFSHPPTALRKMIRLCSPISVITGSRYVKGGKIVGWSWDRYVNSSTANLITRLLLGIKTKDATAGFKCYPIEFFKKINLEKVRASGYAFQVEMILLAQDNGFKSVETPITFVDRKAGESKIKGELLKSAKLVISLAATREETRQFVKFCIVGAINTFTDWLVYLPAKLALFSAFGLANTQTLKQIAKAISFIFSATLSYLMNRTWTFRSKNPAMLKEGSKFMVVATGGLIINSLAFYVSTAVLNLRDIFGLILATAAATLWNFFLNKKWTFKK